MDRRERIFWLVNHVVISLVTAVGIAGWLKDGFVALSWTGAAPWVAGTGVGVALVFSYWVCVLLYRASKQAEELDCLKNKLGELWRGGRAMQQAAFEKVSTTYGYFIEHREQKVLFSNDGSAQTDYSVRFAPKGSVLKSWSRATKSTLACPGESSNRSMATSKREIRHVDSRVEGEWKRVETFHFSTSMGPAESDRDTLTFSTKSQSGAFKAGSGDTDFVSLTPAEPIQVWRLELNLPGEDVQVTAEAAHGSAKVTHQRETLDMINRLQVTRETGQTKVALSLPYPLLGVRYRVIWARPASTTPTA